MNQVSWGDVMRRDITGGIPGIAWVLSFVAGCGSVGMAPTTPAGMDARVRELPAATTLVAYVDVPALGAHATIGDRIRAEDAFGVQGGLWGVDHVVLGCGPDGCVGLADGSLDTVRPPRSPGLRSVSSGPRDHLRGPGGWRGRIDRLGDGKAVFGDRAAVAALRKAHRQGVPAIDAAWLDGLVPSGEVWIAARDAAALGSQASGWLAALDLPAARDALGALEGQADALIQADERVEALALSISGEREQAVVRVRARSEGTAGALAALMRAKLAITSKPDGVVATRVVRDGRYVEVQADLEPDALVALLERDGGAP